MFGSIGDPAPDTWGRRLMQRAERRLAEREGRQVRTLLPRCGRRNPACAMRFRWRGEEVFQAPVREGVPTLVELGRLLQITERIDRDEETDDDLRLIFVVGVITGWCTAQDLSDRSARSFVDCKIPQGKRRLQHRNLGGSCTQIGRTGGH